MDEPFICPECRTEKCRNCDGTAFDEGNDEFVQCECGCRTFERRQEMEHSGN
jgi:hypothetical protein